MKSKKSKVLALVGLMALASCGGGGGGGKSGGNESFNQYNEVAGNPNAKKNLEAWKTRPIKACTLNDVFGINELPADPKDTVLDIGLIVRENGNSAIFNSGSEYVAVSKMESMYGLNSSRTDFSDLNASIERNGNLCKVFINGQEVHRTFLTTKVTINNHWGKPNEKEGIGMDVGISKILATNSNSTSILAKILKLNADQAKQYIQTETNESPYVYRISKDYPWNSLYVNNPETYQIELRLPSPRLLENFGYPINSADVGTIAIILNKNPDIDNRVDYVKYIGVQKYSEEEGFQCLRMMKVEEIDYKNILKNCQVILPGIKRIALEKGVFNELAIKYFQFNRADKSESFYSYKEILKDLVLETNRQKIDIQTIDPEKKSYFITQITNNIDYVRAALGMYESMSSLDNDLASIGFEWAFLKPGEISVNMAMLMNVGMDFHQALGKSYKSIVSKFINDPTSYSAAEALNFANGIQNKSEYAKTAARAYELAKSKHDYSVEKALDQAFQKQVTIEQMKIWIKALEK